MATSIEWTDMTWNPIRGCSRVSDGCRHCYAEAIAARFSNPGNTFHGFAERTPEGPRWTGAVTLLRDRLNEPFHWRAPRRVFVNSMSDLFHEALSFEDIDKVINVMALNSRHTFQVLTKRPERMAQFMRHQRDYEWPLPNVWLGVSVENQACADERIPLLLQTPAAVRFISAEPLLGPIDLSSPVLEADCDGYLDWVIVGGESGAEARPCRLSWIRSIVQQCQVARVACFVKQVGSRPLAESKHDSPLPDVVCVATRADRKGGDPSEWPEDLRVREFPEVHA